MLLLKRIACELVELRTLMFNIHRDPKKSQVLHPHQLAPDLFDVPEDRDYSQQAVDAFGAESMGKMPWQT